MNKLFFVVNTNSNIITHSWEDSGRRARAFLVTNKLDPTKHRIISLRKLSKYDSPESYTMSTEGKLVAKPDIATIILQRQVTIELGSNKTAMLLLDVFLDELNELRALVLPAEQPKGKPNIIAALTAKLGAK